MAREAPKCSIFRSVTFYFISVLPSFLKWGFEFIERKACGDSSSTKCSPARHTQLGYMGAWHFRVTEAHPVPSTVTSPMDLSNLCYQ